MLTKMNLRYLNGQLYKNDQNNQNMVNQVKYETPEPETKEEYIRRIQQKQLERKYIHRQQMEKRKLLISKINATPNKLFQMKLS